MVNLAGKHWNRRHGNNPSSRRKLDHVSRAALNPDPAAAWPTPWYLNTARHVADEPEDTPGGYGSSSLEDVLWEALCDVPEDGADVAELMRMTGLGRSAVYKYLALLAGQGRAVKAGWGRWRAAFPGEGDDE
jgi:hypothetical protein